MGGSTSKPSKGGVGLKEKAAADEQAQKQAMTDLHRYVEDPEDLEMLNLKEAPLIAPEAGFRVELGGAGLDTIASPVLEEVEKHSLYYKNNFCNKPHFNYVGGNGANPLVLSLVQLDKRKDVYGYSVMLRTKKDEYLHSFTAKDKKAALKHAMNTMTELQEVGGLTMVKDVKLSDELAHMEDRILIKAYRVGVVYAGRSVDENAMFSNNEPSEGFKTFMGWLGKHIKLKGYKGFKGGLDVEHNTTGTHSYATDAHGFDIMFHVSTELPYSEVNPQQVERKRHIGNDVVVIIYQDGPTSKPFSPTSITSKFNHVYIIVQAITPNGNQQASENSSKQAAHGLSPPPRSPRAKSTASTNTTINNNNTTTTTTTTTSSSSSTTTTTTTTTNSSHRSKVGGRAGAVEVEESAFASSPSNNTSPSKLQFRIAVVSKHGVHSHGPVLPDPSHIWSLDDTFRQFLLTKIVNAERAAYYAPGFGQARTRRLWLKSLLEKYGPSPPPGSATSDG